MLALFLKTLVIFAVIGFGYLLRRRGTIDAPFNRQLSLVLVNVLYPALIVNTLVRQFTWNTLLQQAWLPAGSALIMVLGWTVGLAVRRRLHRDTPPETASVFHFQCTMNNYSFLPIMLVAQLGGDRAVAQVIYSTLGAELCVWTLGVQALSGQPAGWRALRHLRSMPMGAIAVSIAVLLLREVALPTAWQAPLLALGRPLAGMTLDILQLTGQATIPICALIAGSRMAGLRPHHLFTQRMALTVAVRLALIPALAIAIFRLLPLPADVRLVLLVVAVQPCALNSVTLAEVYRADAEFAAASVLMTHLACLVTIPLWLGAVG